MTDEKAKDFVEKMGKCRDEIMREMAKYAAYKIHLEQGGRHVPEELFVEVLLSRSS